MVGIFFGSEIRGREIEIYLYKMHAQQEFYERSFCVMQLGSDHNIVYVHKEISVLQAHFFKIHYCIVLLKYTRKKK